MDGICSRQKRPAKGTTFFQHPAGTTKEHNAKSFDMILHSQSRRNSSGTMLPRVQALQFFIHAFLEPSQRTQPSWEHRPKTRTCWVDGPLKAASDTTDWRSTKSPRSNVTSSTAHGTKTPWDPLAESDSLRELKEFLRAQRIDESEITRSIGLLGSRRYAESVRPPSTELFPVDSQLDEFLEIDEGLAERKAAAEKLAREKQQVWNKERTRKLGENPKAYRADLRASLQPGIYVSTSVKQRLGQCNMIPRLDYVQHEYAGSSMPNPESFDLTCKWCAKSVGFDASSGTDTSSSTDDVAE